VDEEALVEESECVQAVREVAARQGAEVAKVCARLEEALAVLSEAERREYLELSGAPESGLDQVIHKSYKALNLISFFTMNEQEIRAWTIPAGTKAPQAAGKIHTDFERGFIRAEVVPYETFLRHGSGSAARAAGEMRIEGKDYVVQDGDVIYIRFNV
jgi:ribosome-binding ATPase YchF (GTP1/OBG family)